MRGSRHKRQRLIRRSVLRTVALYEVLGAMFFFGLLLGDLLSSTIVITSHSLFWINPLVQLVACTAGVLLWRFHRMGMRLSLAVQALQLFQLKTTLATLGFKPGLAYWLSASLEPTSLDARYSDSVLRVNLAAVIVLGVLIWYAYRYPGLVEEDGKSAV